MSGGFAKLAGLLFFAFVLSFSKFAMAEKRVALVIGNSAYQHVAELANPRNDAADMAAKLEGLGFEVVQGEDLDLASMRKLAREFTGKLEGADMALFFYAGHGLQVNGNNYMAPIDAQLSSYNDLDYEVLPMDLIMSAMERNTRVNLVFLDACRDNPLADNLARSMGTRSGAVGRGLAKLGSGVGSLIAFATQPGNVALDGKGRNSPFTTALLKHLGTPGQTVTDDLVLVRREVLETTEGKQVPWDNSSLTGPVVLVTKAEEPKPASEPETAPPPQTSNLAEITYWDSIKASTEKGYFESYLARWPQGTFADIAKLKIASLEKSSATPVQPQTPATADNSAELAYWASIRDQSDKSYFEAYLKQYPEGTFASVAKLRIASLERAKPEPVEVAKLDTGPADAVRSVDPAELARSMQTELSRLGCLSGRVDGKWGSGSQKALKDFAGRQGINLASLEPDVQILDRMKSTSVRVCPLVCGRNQEEKNGRCVALKKEAKVDPKPAENRATEDKASTKQGSEAQKSVKSADSCPPNPRDALNQIWKHSLMNGSLTAGGKHPCGRIVACSKASMNADFKCAYR